MSLPKTTKFIIMESTVGATEVMSNEIFGKDTKFLFINTFYKVSDVYYDLERDGNAIYVHICNPIK